MRSVDRCAVARRTAHGVCLLLLAVAATVARGESAPPAAGSESGTIRFRRVFTPADKMGDWPGGSAKYLPMEPAEFNRLLGALQTSSDGSQTQMAVQPLTATYQAKFDAEGFIAGSGSIEMAHTGKAAVLLPLEPCNLAVGKAHWDDPAATPAAWGLGSDGKRQLLVERPGRLQIEWTLAPRRSTSETVNFLFELPPCPINRIDLDLPPKLTPVVDHGRVSDAGPAADGLHRWRIDLGGHWRFRLRLTPGGAAEPRTRLVMLRQSTTYDFSLRGVELSAQWKLEAHNEPLAELPLVLEPGLQLVSAGLGDVPVAWSAAPSPPDKPSRLVLTLPQPLRDGTTLLRLRAVAALVIGPSWKLPRILAEGLFWQDGSTSLVVPAPLSIEQIQPTNCRQSGIEPLTAPRVGEALAFESFGPDAALELSLAQRPTVVQSVSGTATMLGDGKMTSRVVTDFRTGEGSLFNLDAAIMPQWTIDSVESTPADALDDWSLGSRADGRRLAVRLAKPLAANRSVRLVILARRLYATPGRNLGIDDLVPVRFVTSAEDKRLVTVRASGPQELKLVGAERLRQVAPQSLSAAELDLFAQSPGELLFHDDAGTGGLQISLENRKPAFHAAIVAEAGVGNGVCQESYRIVCTPRRSTQLDRVVVHFSRRREVPLRWSLAGESETQFTARPWPAAKQDAVGQSPGEETWNIVFQRPRSTPVEIRAVREVELNESLPVSLASVPDAASQQATLVVRSFGPHPLHVANHRLKLIPSEPTPAGQYQTARATYQYDPVRETAAESEPAVVLAAPRTATVPTAWAWNCEIQSQYAADGTGRHFLSYRLQSAGGGRVHLTLPEASERQDIRGLWVDDVRATPTPGASHDRVLAVDLPPGEKFSTLAVQFITRRGRLRTFGRLEPPLPEIDLPILAGHWTVCLPPGYEACGYLPSRRAAQAEPLSWNQRIFGSLGRPANRPVFNPLSVADWSGCLELESAATSSADSAAGPLAGPPGTLPDEQPGWTTYRLDMPEIPTGLSLVHRPTIRMIGWIAFLLVVGIGAWKLAERPAVQWLLAGVLGFAGMMIPSTLVPVTSGALWGVLLCLAMGLLRRRASAAAAGPASGAKIEPGSTITGIMPFSVPVLAAAMLLLGGATHAAESGKRPDRPAYSVFMPVDENQKPTGGKYLVPEEFFDRLYRGAATRAEKPQGWLIAGATYRASLTKDPATQRFAVEQLVADFDLRVFDASARVRIPFRHEEVRLLPGEALLDGRPIQPEWESDGRALAMDIAEPGDYRLELTLRPTMRPAGGPAGFDLAIPRLPASRLELAAPTNLPVVEAPTAAGAVRWDDLASRWIAELGPADQLSVRWQDAAAGGAAPAVDVEELLWLKILPGSILIDVRLKVKVVAGQFRRLQVATDPALHMLPLAGPDAPTVQVRSTTDQPQVLDLQWSHPIADATTIDARFLWTGVSGVGNLRLPQLGVADVRPTRRWLAVSVDPALEFHMPGPGRLEAVAVPEFTGSWGTTDVLPQFACRLPSGVGQWNLSTRPKRPKTTADQTLALVFDGAGAELRLDAQLATTSGHVFQHRILAPASLRVDRVSVTAEGAPRVARWSQDKLGTISAFLTGPVSGRHELQLRGRLPVAPGEKTPLPLVQIDGARQTSSVVQLFRRPSSLVEVSGVAGLVEVKDPPLESSRTELGRLVQCFRLDPAVTPKATLAVTPNRPLCRAEQITRMSWEDGGWKAAVEGHMHVTGGLVDEIVLDAPTGWVGPLRVVPPASLKNDPGPAPRRRLVLQPRTAISGDYAFTITGPLDPASADRIAAPDIKLVHTGTVQRLLVLPRQFQDQPITWDLQGLRETRLAESASGGPTTAYEVVGEPWHAAFTPMKPPSEAARVRLADLRIAWQDDGSCAGTATFDLSAGKTTQCPLLLPGGARLLSLTVAGVPVDPVPLGEGTWQVPLASEPPVQSVEVLFATDAGAALAEPAAGSILGPRTACRRFHAPQLLGLAVDRTLWTIAGPRSFGVGAAEDAMPVEPDTPAAGAAATAGIPSLWQGAIDEGHAVTRCSTAGLPDAITLRYDRIDANDWPGRLATGAAVALLVALAGYLLRRGTLWECFARWPYTFGVALGLAWWLWLTPGAIGLGLVLFSLLRQFAPGRTHRSGSIRV